MMISVAMMMMMMMTNIANKTVTTEVIDVSTIMVPNEDD
jgi:hypothetical protein